MTYTLLIWENVPEDTKLYVVPNDEITDEQRRYLNEADGKIIGYADMCKGLEFLNAALCSKEEWCADEAPKEWRCIWANKLVAERGQAYGDRGISITRVYVSGMAL